MKCLERDDTLEMEERMLPSKCCRHGSRKSLGRQGLPYIGIPHVLNPITIGEALLVLYLQLGVVPTSADGCCTWSRLACLGIHCRLGFTVHRLSLVAPSLSFPLCCIRAHFHLRYFIPTVLQTQTRTRSEEILIFVRNQESASVLLGLGLVSPLVSLR